MEHQPEHSHFPWTSEGKALLNLINDIIDNNGGIMNMHQIVTKEVGGNSYIIHHQRIHQVFEIVIKYSLTYADAATILGWSIHAFSNKFNQYRRNLITKENQGKNTITLPSKMNDEGLNFDLKHAKFNKLSSLK